MSRIGNAIITIPTGVTMNIHGDAIDITGPKGAISFRVPQGITVAQNETSVSVKRATDEKFDRALHGLVRAHVANMLYGVTNGWSKTLELSGVGYRAAKEGNDLVLSLGFSHPVVIHPPAGITFQIAEGRIIVSGIDKQTVGQVASSIRAEKKPEPYKGKGIQYAGEHIRKKAGKAAKAIGGTSGVK